jgi:transcriptional regulator with XRE-family HTH domain
VFIAPGEGTASGNSRNLPSRIVSIENGRGSTTVDLIEKLAEALDVAPARLLTPDEE